MRITLLDTRQLVGRFMAFDKHMNVVLGDCEEFRYLPPKKSKDEEEVRLRCLPSLETPPPSPLPHLQLHSLRAPSTLPLSSPSFPCCSYLPCLTLALCP